MKKLEEQAWWPELIEKKDEMSLRELASIFGVSAAAIGNALRRNGISRTSAPSGPKKGGTRKAAARTKSTGPKTPPAARRPRRRRSKLAPYRAQMGKVVDREIAEAAGVTVSAVTNYRKRHNIGAASGRGRPRGSGRAKAGRTVRSVGRQGVGYRVIIGGEPFVIIAKNIAEAADKASREARGEVTQIERLGRALG